MGSAKRRMCAAVAVTLMFGTWTVVAQQAPGKWVTGKYAPVPEPSEEYTNAVSNGKLYLIGGNSAVLTPGGKTCIPRASSSTT